MRVRAPDVEWGTVCLASALDGPGVEALEVQSSECGHPAYALRGAEEDFVRLYLDRFVAVADDGAALGVAFAHL